MASAVVSLSVAGSAARAVTERSASLRHGETERVYVVRPGDTLWALAARIAGREADPRPVVDRIASVNHLSDVVLQPGQRLVVPAA